MSAAGVAYHLRPHKTVDRRLFLDLLSRFERWRPLSNYVYLSMGAYPLEDHKLIHRLIGIARLIAFDSEARIVQRQKFNRPIERCACIVAQSGEIIDRLDAVLAEAECADADGVVFWLDYTDPTKLGQQIREFQALLDKLRAGDVVRVTINAHPMSISTPIESGTSVLAEEKRKAQFEKLSSRIRDFLPSWASADSMTKEDLPKVLAQAFENAALKALPVTGRLAFQPLSIVRYADGLQMLSITGTVVNRAEEAKMLGRIDIVGWPFASTNWSTIHKLVVPHLTLRERLFLERGIGTRSASELISELGFDVAGDVPLSEFLENYKSYYRFYPTLLATDV